MKRRKRTELLIASGPETARAMAQEIERAYEIEEIVAPREALVMIKKRETAKRSLFYLGELSVTECKVRVASKMGLGVVKGHNLQLAYDLAVIDAAVAADLPECTDWELRLNACEAQLEAQIAKREASLGKTKVDFSTMQV